MIEPLKGGENMLFNWDKVDWAGLVKAVLKAAFPFLAGAAGGLLSGCTIGAGPNFLF